MERHGEARAAWRLEMPRTDTRLALVPPQLAPSATQHPRESRRPLPARRQAGRPAGAPSVQPVGILYSQEGRIGEAAHRRVGESPISAKHRLTLCEPATALQLDHNVPPSCFLGHMDKKRRLAVSESSSSDDDSSNTSSDDSSSDDESASQGGETQPQLWCSYGSPFDAVFCPCRRRSCGLQQAVRKVPRHVTVRLPPKSPERALSTAVRRMPWQAVTKDDPIGVSKRE
jgi:hypothetical protein